jgi:hypothetical protein
MTPRTDETGHIPRADRSGTQRTSLAVAVSAALLLAFAALGCGQGSPEATPGSTATPPMAVDSSPAEEARSGSLSLALQAGNTKLTSVTYTIIGGSFVKSGSIDVSNSTRLSAVIGGIPFGTNYALTLASSGVGPPQTDCSGSATFDITGPGPTPVGVQLSCRQAVVAVTPPPTPAPIPPLPIFVLALALLGLGVAVQRRPLERR